MRTPEYQLPWKGGYLGDEIAFDTETAVQDVGGRAVDLAREVPELMIATASGGRGHCVLSPDQIAAFIRTHKDNVWVGHNMAFDFWVVYRHLLDAGQHAEAAMWTHILESGRMQDTMILDYLVRLASDLPTADGMRDLGKVAALVGCEADKSSPYRMMFHELRGVRDYASVDRGFFDYAVQDTVVTLAAYRYLSTKAGFIAGREKVDPAAIRAYGVLTSTLQLRAAVALANIGRTGMAIDQERTEAAHGVLRADLDKCIAELSAMCPSIFNYYKVGSRKGERKANKTSGVPNLNYSALRLKLVEVADRAGVEVQKLPKTPTGLVVTTLPYWRAIAPADPLVEAWGKFADTAKLLQFVRQVRDVPSVHPRYQVCVRTGRTSCSDPNITQMPREKWFRDIFRPRAGHSYIIVDYSAIELRTLAAVLLDRFGQSRLAEVLQQGVCPHSYTAAMVMGLDYETVRQGVKDEKAAGAVGKYTRARQAAKAINFGVPGGLGSERLCEYARANYGVDMSPGEAAQLRSALVNDVYPELFRYLSYDIFSILAKSMDCSRDALCIAFLGEGLLPWHVERVVRRDGVLGNKKKLPDSVRAKVWDILEKHNRTPQLADAIAAWGAGTRGLAAETATTLTGRVRGGLDYSEARNTPFQGLAADGAKIALYRLWRTGHKVVAFIHDEIICESPKGREAQDSEGIRDIMIDSMSQVLGYKVPVEVEVCIGDSWGVK